MFLRLCWLIKREAVVGLYSWLWLPVKGDVAAWEEADYSAWNYFSVFEEEARCVSARHRAHADAYFGFCDLLERYVVSC